MTGVLFAEILVITVNAQFLKDRNYVIYPCYLQCLTQFFQWHNGVQSPSGFSPYQREEARAARGGATFACPLGVSVNMATLKKNKS